MGELLNRLDQKGVLVSDGAWGTALQSRGLQGGECPEEWNASHPDEVKSVALAYAEVGCDLILTNTFGSNRCKLARKGLEDRVAELNEAGARLSVEGAPRAVIAASIGPTGEFLEPLGEMTAAQMEEVFREQIAAVLRGGVHAVCVETMTALEEAACAVRVARSLAPQIDILATMTFDAGAKGYRTIMGVDCATAARELVAAGADVVGANCGNGPRRMVDVMREMRDAVEAPLVVHANAGMPELVNGETVFRLQPEEMAAVVDDLIGAGASILGGCCGTTPAHIAAIRSAVDRRAASS